MVGVEVTRIPGGVRWTLTGTSPLGSVEDLVDALLRVNDRLVDGLLQGDSGPGGDADEPV
jgi:hypothetical protein